MHTDPRITLLGPQRNPRLKQVVRSLGLRDSRFATITAGWRDREGEDDLLNELLGQQTVNLRLWALMQRLWEADPELEAADRERRLVLSEMQRLYVIGLEQAVETLYRLRAHKARAPWVKEQALADTLQVLRELDDTHVERVAEVHEVFYQRLEPHHRPAVVEARARVGGLIADCDAVVIPGGHVGVLLGALHIFNLAPAMASPAPTDGTGPRLYRPVIAWGAGAMALTERVLLFYDNSVSSPGVSEVLMDGLGLTRGLVALPSAKDRLDVKDRLRMRTLAERSAPRVPLPLDEGAMVTLTPDGRLPEGARVVGTDGSLVRHQGEETDPPPAPEAADPGHDEGQEPA